MKNFAIIFALELDAENTKVNQNLFKTKCDQIIARLKELYPGYVKYTPVTEEEFIERAHPADPIEIEILLQLTDAYNPINYYEEEIQNLLAGEIDYPDTVHFNCILDTIDYLLDGDEEPSGFGWTVKRLKWAYEDDIFKADRIYKLKK